MYLAFVFHFAAPFFSFSLSHSFSHHVPLSVSFFLLYILTGRPFSLQQNWLLKIKLVYRSKERKLNVEGLFCSPSGCLKSVFHFLSSLFSLSLSLSRHHFLSLVRATKHFRQAFNSTKFHQKRCYHHQFS